MMVRVLGAKCQNCNEAFPGGVPFSESYPYPLPLVVSAEEAKDISKSGHSACGKLGLLLHLEAVP